jgi:hypothetical protein
MLVVLVVQGRYELPELGMRLCKKEVTTRLVASGR